nr:hypothetical protein [Tanacetum cinerariifolium]
SNDLIKSTFCSYLCLYKGCDVRVKELDVLLVLLAETKRKMDREQYLSTKSNESGLEMWNGKHVARIVILDGREMLYHLESVLANKLVAVKSRQYIVEVKPQVPVMCNSGLIQPIGVQVPAISSLNGLNREGVQLLRFLP